MKKIIIISMLLLAAVVYFAANPRVYVQWVTLNDGSNPPNCPLDGTSPNPDYIYSVYNSSNPFDVIATNTASNPNNVCIKLQTTSGKVIALVNQSLFAANWPIGSTLYCTVTYIPTNESVTWTRVVPSGSTINDINEPKIIPPTVASTHIISGTISSQWDLSGVTISATGIEPNNITYNAVTGAYSVTVPDGWSGNITPFKTDYIFEPPSRSYTDPVVADIPEQDFTMKTVVVPGVPTNLSPPNGTILTYNVATPVVLSWDAVANAEGYKLIWNNGEVQDLQTNLTWTTPALGAGTYTWKVCAYNNTATKKFNTPVRVQINSRSTSTTNSPKVDGGWAEASFEVVIVANTYTVQISSVPEGAAILVNNVDTGFVTPHTFSMEEGASATYTVQMANYTWTPTEFVVTNISENMSCNFVLTWYEDGNAITPPGVTIGSVITIQMTMGTAFFTTGTETPPVNTAWNMGYVQFLTLLGSGPWQITINTTYSFVWVVGVGVFTGPFPMTITIPATKDRDIEIQFGEGGDPTLPVELSYFAATLTAENFVNIAWTTQTETNMNGFNIYRNDGSDNLASANRIAYIPATNTSTTQNYNLIDREVEIGHTYYYWLECIEMNNHSTFNGPSPIYVNGPTPPVLPEYTKMHNAYPNPFRAGSGTTITVEVKKGDSGTVTIYNILGQVVKTFSLTEGTNNLSWNGRDSKGNLCGNGIYFYKLSTNSLNQTKKMVIVK